MSAYTICKELLPPQTVEHVEKAQFTSPYSNNLLVARGTLLEIYDFVERIVEPVTVEESQEIDEALDQEPTIKERFDQDMEQVGGRRHEFSSMFNTQINLRLKGTRVPEASTNSF